MTKTTINVDRTFCVMLFVAGVTYSKCLNMSVFIPTFLYAILSSFLKKLELFVYLVIHVMEIRVVFLITQMEECEAIFYS
jgi:hypothetical protein